MNAQKTVEIRLERLEGQLDLISTQLQQLLDAKQPFSELSEEFGPIANEVMAVSIQKLASLDKEGYFTFASELRHMLRQLVVSYQPSDLRELANNMPNILDTVKLATQPTTMALLRDLVSGINEHKPKAIGAFGAMRRVGREKDIQRGLGFALDLLGSVGRSLARSPRLSRASGLAAKTLPAQTLQAPIAAVQKNASHASVSNNHNSQESTSHQASTVTSSVASAATTSVYIEDEQWGADYVNRVAKESGVAELNSVHWKLINFAREDYKTNKLAPNIRRLSKQTGVSTRDIYSHFPNAPGVTISKVAGIPKPAGCL